MVSTYDGVVLNIARFTRWPPGKAKGYWRELHESKYDWYFIGQQSDRKAW
jgi:hypothetical protein